MLPLNGISSAVLCRGVASICDRTSWVLVPRNCCQRIPLQKSPKEAKGSLESITTSHEDVPSSLLTFNFMAATLSLSACTQQSRD